MKIVFFLPQEGSHPIGGFKVVYEYANRLAQRGHDVHLVHLGSAAPKNSPRRRRDFLDLYRFFNLAIRGNWRPDGWFALDPKVKLHWVPKLAKPFLPQADVYVATWWTTAERLAGFSLPGARRLYLIQHLETWAFLPEAVMATWKAPLEKIVIARWLQEIADDLGEDCHYIPNGLDFSKFGCDAAPQARHPSSVAMLFNNISEWKGSEDGLQAILELKLRYPELRAELFGVMARPETLPSWIAYHHRPSPEELRRIYNRAAIFLAPSHSEGWGLPPCEAMMCGAAVVATDIGGHREFCVDEQNSLLVPAKNPRKLADAAARLIADGELRVRLAHCGNRTVQRFTWEIAVAAFEKVLLERPAQSRPTEVEYELQA